MTLGRLVEPLVLCMLAEVPRNKKIETGADDIYARIASMDLSMLYAHHH
jgi:hypothetical protein